MTLLSQFESVAELLSLLQMQHIATQSTIATLESKVTSLETLVQSLQAQEQIQSSSLVIAQSQLSLGFGYACTFITFLFLSLLPNSPMQMLTEWKKSTEGQ
ncbi:hypothetical protein PILCRDRAFT_8338 [Piloderma croceum F 1598]|uniref:Uncharacterized protein n=1 Tax=Piloderma croceum (strain F 1598) TaxID=765440 RepID=A0A0C3FBX5_PILCF|nr:hypothetical protein PILCRDRAFT_8338 [Piloderma croceum F 1598]